MLLVHVTCGTNNRNPRLGVTRKGSPRSVLIGPLFFRFVRICSSCFRECPISFDLFRFAPQNFVPIEKRRSVRETPCCRSVLQVPGKAPRRRVQLNLCRDGSLVYEQESRSYLAFFGPCMLLWGHDSQALVFTITC